MGGASATYADSILVGKLSDRDHLKELGINGKIILTHCGRVTEISVFNTVNSVHLQVLLSATPQGGTFPEVSHLKHY
jgi:hypothetical protein